MAPTLSRAGVQLFQVRGLPLRAAVVQTGYQAVDVGAVLDRVVPPVRHLVLPAVDPQGATRRVDPGEQPATLFALRLRQPEVAEQPTQLVSRELWVLDVRRLEIEPVRR